MHTKPVMTPSLCPRSYWHIECGAQHHMDPETLQWVAAAVGGGGVRRGVQAQHGAHRLAALVQPHVLHQVWLQNVWFGCKKKKKSILFQLLEFKCHLTFFKSLHHHQPPARIWVTVHSKINKKLFLRLNSCVILRMKVFVFMQQRWKLIHHSCTHHG